MEKLLLKIPEASLALGIGRSTLYELIAAGELRVIRVGKSVRISVDELRRWVEQRGAA